MIQITADNCGCPLGAQDGTLNGKTPLQLDVSTTGAHLVLKKHHPCGQGLVLIHSLGPNSHPKLSVVICSDLQVFVIMRGDM